MKNYKISSKIKTKERKYKNFDYGIIMSYIQEKYKLSKFMYNTAYV